MAVQVENNELSVECKVITVTDGYFVSGQFQFLSLDAIGAALVADHAGHGQHVRSGRRNLFELERSETETTARSDGTKVYLDENLPVL